MREVYLGIDAGSSSIKFAITDREKNLIDSLYLKNYGLIETTKKGLERIAREDYNVIGVCTTGSGRNFLGLLIGTDMSKTEILAHSISCLHYYPNCRTLIDIGAEDNKAITFDGQGVIQDFVMNNMCAGGCGQTLEMIANRLGVKIEDVGKLALKSKNKLNISSKCGIFMNSMVVSYRNSGQRDEDILSGVINGITENYLKMIQEVEFKPPFVFQSATAKNEAIVKSLENDLDSDLIIHPYCDVAGAIGASFLAQRNTGKSNFRGFEISEKDYKTRMFTAKGCDNNCEITLLYDENKYVGAIGNRCDHCIRKL